MTVRGAALLGIGAMVGAGIFALLGEAGAVAGAATWISFLLAGIVSLLIGYNVVKLGVRYPSSGGLFEYLLQGFGNGRLLGIAAWLGYMSAVLIVCSMCAVSFGDYAVSLFVSDGGADWWDNVFASAIVVAMALVVVMGPQLVARAQSLIVFIMVGILAVFVAVTLPSIDLDMLAFGEYPSVADIVASVALTFFAFLGFSVITFAVGDMRNPASDLPKAMNRALGVTTLVYILVAVSVFGTLTVAEVVAYGPDRDRRGGPSGARGRGIHDDRDRRHGRHGRVGRRDALRLVRAHADAVGRRPVPAVLRPRLAARREERRPDQRSGGAPGGEHRGPLGDRLGGKRLLARDLRPRRRRRLPVASGDGRPGMAHPASASP